MICRIEQENIELKKRIEELEADKVGLQEQIRTILSERNENGNQEMVQKSR